MAKIISEGFLPDDHEVYNRGAVVITGSNINSPSKKTNKELEKLKKENKEGKKTKWLSYDLI